MEPCDVLGRVWGGCLEFDIDGCTISGCLGVLLGAAASAGTSGSWASRVPVDQPRAMPHRTCDLHLRTPDLDTACTCAMLP